MGLSHKNNFEKNKKFNAEIYNVTYINYRSKAINL